MLKRSCFREEHKLGEIIRKIFKISVLTVTVAVTAQASIAKAGDAPRDGLGDFYWSSGNKDFFGTAYEAYDSQGEFSLFSPTAPISKVWFTGSQGVLTEIFWPTVDRRQTRDTQFLVSDGSSFFKQERGETYTETEWTERGLPIFKVLTRDPEGRFSIQKTIFTDPDRDAVIMKVRFERRSDDLKLYLLHNPAAANTGLGDSGRALSKTSADGWAPGFYAWQGSDAQALHSTKKFRQVSAAFGGKWDGFSDLRENFRMDHQFERALDGNVVFLGEVELDDTRLTEEFLVVIGFATSPEKAMNVALAASQNTDRSLEVYRNQWLSYFMGLANLSAYSAGHPDLYHNSVTTMKSLEDKTFPGAVIAGPSVPWGLMKKDPSKHYEAHSENFWRGRLEDARRVDQQTGGYQLVWVRDLYHVATAFIAAGDIRSAIANLRYMERLQFKEASGAWSYGKRQIERSGAWPQNTWVNGEAHWKMLQMDQVAMPILLVYHLWKIRAVELRDWWPMVRRASDFLVKYGPWTFQDRWEENMGLSPNTISYEISALSGAAEMAEALGERNFARQYTDKARSWMEKLDGWVFTERGTLGRGQYYLRSEASSNPDAEWNPNDDALVQITNGGAQVLERSLIDGGFLDLVRLGIKAAFDSKIQATLAEYDRHLQREWVLPRTYIRYNGDAYNWDERTGEQLSGGIWPLLTAERAHMAVAAAQAEGRSAPVQMAVLFPYIETMEKLSTQSGYIPEQRRSDIQKAGELTGAVSPLAWSHAEYIKLLRKRADISL